jgi:hypothetical protein
MSHINYLIWRPTLLFLSIASGLILIARLPFSWDAWQPDECRLRNCFCEPIHADQLALQPINALSDLPYILCGLLIFDAPAVPAKRRLFQRAFGAGLLVAGFFSFFYHASLTAAGAWFDLMGVYLISETLLFYNLSRLQVFSRKVITTSFVVILILLGIQMVLAPGLQQICFIGLLVGAGCLEIAVRRIRQPNLDDRWMLAGLTSFALSGFIWVFSERILVCNPASPIPWLAGWHLFSALAAGFLFLYYASER